MSLSVTYLSHSGFLVDTGAHVLIFDYYRDTPRNGGLAQGVFRPAAFSGRDVTVFVSHHHGDHYNPCIFTWRETLPDIRYILADDVWAKGEQAAHLAPCAHLETGGLSIDTLPSTDEGVAFLVGVDGYTLYHAGDLNWWHWAGEPDSWNQSQETRYKAAIDSIAGRAVDAAFLPTDPRLGEAYLWGMRYFAEKVPARHLVPMHLWGRYSVCEQIQKDPQAEHFRLRVAGYRARGAQVISEE